MIATDMPGCREIAIEGETGLTVPPRNAPALADAIETLARLPELRTHFGRNARKLAETKFAADLIGRATTELYLRLIAEAG